MLAVFFIGTSFVIIHFLDFPFFVLGGFCNCFSLHFLSRDLILLHDKHLCSTNAGRKSDA